MALLAQVREARAALSDDQLDLGAAAGASPRTHQDTDDRTSVIPRSLSVQRPLPVNDDDSRAAPHELPAVPAARPPRGGRGRGRRLAPRRGVLAIVAAVLLALGLGAGVWYINSGQFTKVPPLLSKTEAQAEKQLAKPGST